MVLELLATPKTIPDLIARKKFSEALALLQEQLKKNPRDTSLRMQTADVFALQGKIDDATRLLETVADDFATEGFAAKAIAVLKKIQKLNPRRRDLESRIVELFKATAPPDRPAAEPEFGMLPPDEGPELDIGVNVQPDSAAPEVFEVPVVVVEEPPLELVQPPGSDAPARHPELAEPRSGEALRRTSTFDAPFIPIPETSRMRSPLFDDLSESELLDVVRGLELLTFEPGDIIVTEGEKGESLYVLTSGTAKAFVRNRDGGSTQVRQLGDGDFFGEISILTGKPRTATITAAAPCEMLRLDRAALDAITATHPRVREVLEKFYEERANNAAEAEIRGLDAGSSETCRRAGLTDDQPAAPPPATERIVITEEDLQDDTAEVSPLHLRNVAIEHSRRQNWTDAVLAWQQYLAVKPEDLDAANVLGVLFGKLGRWQEAAETFARVVEQNPRDATAFFNLGLSYRQLDLLPQAADAYRRALALKPDYEKAKQNLSSIESRLRKSNAPST